MSTAGQDAPSQPAAPGAKEIQRFQRTAAALQDGCNDGSPE